MSGSSGIGPGAALALAAAGAKVVVATRRGAECRELVDEVKARCGEAAFARVDVLIPDRRGGRGAPGSPGLRGQLGRYQRGCHAARRRRRRRV
ncbi:SDR family NAD(P)-dependent oxidoreductase [Sorangium sp. So ce1182]|uniref:SDR family NAD(P)-dependent oxidoreductase n=1 Tax=Sorangium sp. So ce1182 TaxID=3133334 RepID=UPI003F621E62